MIIRPSDRALSDEEWKELLRVQDFGTLIAPGRDRDFPVVSPSHFAFDGSETIILHFVRDNPVWEALAERPLAMLSVIADYAFIPGYWNAGEEAPEEWGVPTSYYATVQASGVASVVDAPAELAELLDNLMNHFQPEGRHARIEAGDNPYARQFPAIRGLRLTITQVRAKFKFGGNRPPGHRQSVAAAMAERDGPGDAGARARLLRRLAASTSSAGPPSESSS